MRRPRRPGAGVQGGGAMAGATLFSRLHGEIQHAREVEVGDDQPFDLGRPPGRARTRQNLWQRGVAVDMPGSDGVVEPTGRSHVTSALAV